MKKLRRASLLTVIRCTSVLVILSTKTYILVMSQPLTVILTDTVIVKYMDKKTKNQASVKAMTVSVGLPSIYYISKSHVYAKRVVDCDNV